MKEGARSCTMALGGRACVQARKMLKIGVARSCLGARVHRAKFLAGGFQDLHGLPVCVFVLGFWVLVFCDVLGCNLIT